MQDDFNFDYVNSTKEQSKINIIKKCKDAIGLEPTIDAEWYGFIVLDTDKQSPECNKELHEVLFRSCDSMYVLDDNKHEIKRIN
jgi:hypothetical protein